MRSSAVRVGAGRGGDGGPRGLGASVADPYHLYDRTGRGDHREERGHEPQRGRIAGGGRGGGGGLTPFPTRLACRRARGPGRPARRAGNDWHVHSHSHSHGRRAGQLFRHRGGFPQPPVKPRHEHRDGEQPEDPRQEPVREFRVPGDERRFRQPRLKLITGRCGERNQCERNGREPERQRPEAPV